MEHLHSQVPNFIQLVAVDAELDVFSRLWCIAELVQASKSGIAQRVCLPSNQALSLDNGDMFVYERLATLRGEDCSATRAADKEEILRKIPDRAEFDSQLQTLILGDRGLLRERIVGFDGLMAVARTARRVCVAAGVI